MKNGLSDLSADEPGSRDSSVREECLDQILILNEPHLHRVLKEYVTYFNHARPHQGIEQQIPAGGKRGDEHGPVRCRDVLGGIIHDYYRQVACPFCCPR